MVSDKSWEIFFVLVILLNKQEKPLFLKLLVVAYCQMQQHGDT